MVIQAIRGATTVQSDTAQEIEQKTKKLLADIIKANSLSNDEIVYILFTATDDIESAYPAVAARKMGLDNIPLLCFQEMNVAGSLDKCIRVLMLIQRADKSEILHVYQEKATTLRPDLMDKQKRSDSIDGTSS